MDSVTKQLLLLWAFSLICINLNSQIYKPAFSNERPDTALSCATVEDAPIARDDTLTFDPSCLEKPASINIMTNDSKCYSDGYMVFIKQYPGQGAWQLKSNGEFTYKNSEGFLGTVVFDYKLCKIGNHEISDEAQIVVNIIKDTDCDGVGNEHDLDDDNDGIIDYDDGFNVDSDNDSIPNHLDIDSDNDGIPDNIEGQPEDYYLQPLLADSDEDGWDDAYDPDDGGFYFSVVDTDEDGMPDFVDTNSDNDKFNDYNEAFDADFDTIPDLLHSHVDSDKDGLDDSFDTVDGWLSELNPTGHNAPLPDYNDDGVRDWRDAKSIKPVPGLDEALHHSSLVITPYPNPASNYFKLDFPPELLTEKTTLHLFNQNGKKILEMYLEDKSAAVNISHLKSGDYILQLNCGSHSYHSRLIIGR